MTSIESVSRADYEINNGGVDPFENLVHHVRSLVLGQRSDGGFEMEEKREEKRAIQIAAPFTVEDVAEALNITTGSVYRLVKQGRLRATRLGGRRTLRFRQCDIDALFDNEDDEHTENPPDGG